MHFPRSILLIVSTSPAFICSFIPWIFLIQPNDTHKLFASNGNVSTHRAKSDTKDKRKQAAREKERERERCSDLLPECFVTNRETDRQTDRQRQRDKERQRETEMF